MSKGIFIGLDIGYGYTKVYTKEKQVKFPTLVSADITRAIDTSGYVKFEDKEYWVGIDGRDFRSKNFVLTPQYKALLLYSIASVVDTSPAVVNVGIGIPPSMKNLKEKIKEMNEGRIEFQVEDRKYELDIRLHVFLEGWGGYIDHIYSLDKGYLSKNDIPSIYSDWGYYTIATLVTKKIFKGGLEKVIPSFPKISPTVHKGVSYLYDIYRRLLERKGEIIPSIRIAERKFLSGEFPEEREKALNIWKEELVEDVLSNYEEDIYDVEAIVLFGGGASLVEDTFKERFPHLKIKRSDDFANARGYYKALLYFAQKK